MGGGKKLSLTVRFVLIVGLLLLIGNSALGYTIFAQSSSAMRDLINKNMLDVVSSAAGSLDGDALGALTADDVDGPVFKEIERRLLVFQENVDIRFIYAVKQAEDGRYVFTVDPDPVDPGAFGEEIVTTPALVAAGKGVPTVDSKAVADRWGNFYSAYSPVYDSSGKVAGVVGIDFDAEWYDEQVRQHTVTITAISTLNVLLGVVAVTLMTNHIRKQLKRLDTDLSALSNDVDHLMTEISSYSSQEKVVVVSSSDGTKTDDEIEHLSHKIRIMQTEMSFYLEHLHRQAYVDSLTQAGNSSAYHQKTTDIDAKAASGDIDYWVLVFDLNGLKEINDTYGHEEGDKYIMAAANTLRQGFGHEGLYRVGGDEFVVIAVNVDDEYIQERLGRLTQAIETFNERDKSCRVDLSLSEGAARFDPQKDASFKDVFARADQTMYENKREHYRAMGKPVR